MKTLRVTCDTKLRIPLDELTEIQGGLKEMTTERYEKFKRLVLKKGLWFACHVWNDGHPSRKGKWWIIDGHGRKKMLSKLRSEGYSIPEIPCVEIEAKSLKEAKEAVLAASSNFQRATGEGLYEFMSEAGFTMDDLGDFDLPDIDLEDFKDEFFADQAGEAGPVEEEDELYTKKIEAPIYEPKSKVPPKVSELTDSTKTKQLLEEIGKSNVPGELRLFLQVAAQRHTVFDYQAIAEYYAHAPKEVQALFEKSALVIIDYQKAIENGFVALSEKLAAAYAK